MKILLLIALLGLGLTQITVTTSTSKCSCTQYLSQADCQSSGNNGACIWGTTCTAPVCTTAAATSTQTAQQVCNSWNGCAWTSSGTCATVACASLTSTLIGASCSTKGCSNAATANADGSYNCVAYTQPTVVACSSLTASSTACATMPYCYWNSTTCVDATCSQLSTANCSGVYSNSAATASSLVYNTCVVSGTTCTNAVASSLQSTNCLSASQYTYTWSTAKAACVNCATGSANVLAAFLIGFITIFA